MCQNLVLPFWKIFNQMLQWQSDNQASMQEPLEKPRPGGQSLRKRNRLGGMLRWKLPESPQTAQEYIDAKLHRLAIKSKGIKKKKDKQILPQGLDRFDPMFYHPRRLSTVQFVEREGWELRKHRIKE